MIINTQVNHHQTQHHNNQILLFYIKEISNFYSLYDGIYAIYIVRDRNLFSKKLYVSLEVRIDALNTIFCLLSILRRI